MSFHEIGRNELCPCGSGKKFKRCCYRKKDRSEAVGGPVEYPIGTVAQYGPDDKTITKIAAGVILYEDAEPIMKRWVATDITSNSKMQQELTDFFREYSVTKVVGSPGIMGCPHEEGEDFPEGEDCPFCPFWKGKQGSNRRN
jgi:SEC-C motif